VTWRIEQGDCLEFMAGMDAGSIDAIITDLPYGTTACKWDVIIPFVPMWAAVKRVLKPRGAFVTTASQPFTSALVMSNTAWFKYCWVWEKTKASDFLNAKNKPMKAHEDIVVFSDGTTANCSPLLMTYNPQMENGKSYVKQDRQEKRVGPWPVGNRKPFELRLNINDGERFPRSVLHIANPNNGSDHPTQKPVALYTYLIRTYTNEGDTVLDFCMGSGTTIVAAIQEGRDAIGIELDPGYVAIAERRCAEAAMQGRLEGV
jgi:site-specific DNA-methyltransferase (adenine-specific)